MKTNLAPAHFKNTQVAVTTTSQQFVGQDGQRTYLGIHNGTSGTIYVDFGVTATTASWPIAAGAVWEPPVPPLDAINILGTSAGNVNILTGQLSA